MPGSPRGQPASGGGGIEFAMNVVHSNLAFVRQFDRFAASDRQFFHATNNYCERRICSGLRINIFSIE